jgi:hypothetical protein
MTNLALFTKDINDKNLIQKFLMKVGRKYPSMNFATEFEWDELNDILTEVQS